MVFRRLSDDEITQIVSDAAANSQRRLATVRAAGTRPKLSTSSARKSPEQKLSDAKTSARETLGQTEGARIRQQMEQDRRDDLERSGWGWINTVADIGNSVYGFGLPKKLSDSVASDILEPMEADETPQNFAQWSLNLLGTGLYTSARVVENVITEGRNVAEAESDDERAAALGRATLGSVGSAARGVAEGLGFRFNGERPRTQGQNLELLGVNDAIREGVEAAGGSEDGGGFFNNSNTMVGLAGLTADIIGDPLTYVAGTGFLKFARGATGAAGDAVRAGTKNPVAIANAARREGAAARAAYLAQLGAERAARRETRRNRNQGAGITLTQATGNTFAGGVREATERATDDLLNTMRVTGDDAARAGEAPDVQQAVADVQPEATTVPNPRIAELDDVARGMETSPSVESAMPAARDIVAESTVRQVTDEVSQLNTGAIRNIAAELSKKPKAVQRPEFSSQSEMVREYNLELMGAAPKYASQAPGADAALAVINREIAELRKTAAGRAFLRQPVYVPGRRAANGEAIAGVGETTLEAAMRGAVFDSSIRKQISDDLIYQVSKVGEAPMIATAATRDVLDFDQFIEQLTGYNPSIARSVTAEDVARLSDMGEESRLAFIAQKYLSESPRAIRDFDDAMQAAMTSQLSAKNMRILLKQLGIKGVKNQTPAQLRETLSGRGLTTWEKLKASTVTREEVLVKHNIDDDVVTAAERIDADALVENSVETVREASEELTGNPSLVDDAINEQLGVDEIMERIQAGEITREGVDLTGDVATTVNGARSGLIVATIARAIDNVKKNPSPRSRDYTESYDMNEWLAAHRGAVRTLANPANSRRLGDGVKGLSGQGRATFMYDTYMQAMRVVTARMLAEGRVPRLQREIKRGDEVSVEQPLFLSVDQILDMLPRELGEAAMFGSLRYNLTKFGEGFTDAAREVQKQGLSVYPTTLAMGAKSAMYGDDAGKIFARMQRAARSAFEKTDEGQELLKNIANVFAREDTASALRLIHDAQEVAYVAFSMRAANSIVNDLASRIIASIGRRAANGGDRGHTVAEINYAMEEVAKLADEGDMSLVRDLVEQRVGNGVLAALGQADTLILRHDNRMAAAAARALDNDRRAAERAARAAQNSKPAKTADGSVKQPSGGRSAAAKAEEQRLRDELNRAGAQSAREAEPLVTERVATMIDNGNYEATDLAVIQARSEALAELGIYQLFSRLGQAMLGSFGMQRLKYVQTRLTQGLYNTSESYVIAMNKWINGGRIGDTLGAGGVKAVGVGERLARDLGVAKVSVDDINRSIGQWWESLARAEEMIEATGRAVTDDALRDMLSRGTTAGPAQGGAQYTIAPLSDAQVDMALELWGFINEVFEPQFGPLARLGADTSDLAAAMGKFGFRDGGDFADAPRFDPELPLADQVKRWRAYDMTAVKHPLDALANTHKAMSATAVRVQIGRSMSSMFDHRALEPNTPVAELARQGWRRLDTSDTNSMIAKYADPDSYFPPDLIKEMSFLDNFLKQMDKVAIDGLGAAFMQNVVRPYDIATGILKSAQTIWNVSHHLTNVMGENLAILMAGRNPAHATRSLKVIRAANKALDADVTPLDDYLRTIRPPASYGATEGLDGGVAAARWREGWTRVTLADGRKVDVSPEEMFRMAADNGVAVTARHSKDLMPGIGDDGPNFAGGLWKQITNSRLNLIARADRRLGELSATRDNITRIGHFMTALEDRPFRSIDEAIQFAASEVHRYHPTIQTMSAFDQKVGRRVIMYYTWVKQMAVRVVATAIERPALITLPQKAQYNMAEANGLEPESLGKPFNDDPRIAGYYKKGVLGPTYLGGYAPFSGPEDIPIDPETGEPVDDPQMWGFTLNGPQADALFTLFGGLNAGENPIEASWHYAQLGNVFLKSGVELLADSRVGGIGAPPSQDYGNYFASMTGAPYRVASAINGRPKAGMSDEQNEGERLRLLANLFSGMRFTNYTNATSEAVARTERSREEREALERAGYTEEEIEAIRKVWAAAREMENQ